MGNTYQEFFLEVIIYIITILIALMLDIYILSLSLKKKKLMEDIFSFCIFNIIFSNLCHIFSYSINFFNSSPKDSFICLIQATLLNSLILITDLFILLLSITLLTSVICGVNYSKMPESIKYIIMFLLYIIPFTIFSIIIKKKEGKSGFNGVFCYSSDESNNNDKRKLIILCYGSRIIVIFISLLSFLFLYLYLKKKKGGISSIKIFFITFIQIFFGFPALFIRIKQYIKINEYVPKETEMWIICFSYSLAGICYPLSYSMISGLSKNNRKEYNESKDENENLECSVNLSF